MEWAASVLRFLGKRIAARAGFDIDANEAKLGREQNPALRRIGTACHGGYGRRCRKTRRSKRNIGATITGGDDVISMPRYFKRWEDGLPSLRSKLKKVDDVAYFAKSEKKNLRIK